MRRWCGGHGPECQNAGSWLAGRRLDGWMAGRLTKCVLLILLAHRLLPAIGHTGRAGASWPVTSRTVPQLATWQLGMAEIVCCQIIAAGRSCQIPHDGRQDHRDGAGSRGQFKTNLKFNEFIKKSVTALSKHNLPTFRLLLMACQIS